MSGGSSSAGAGGKSAGGSSATGGQTAGGSGNLTNLTLYIASDSTASTYTNSAIHQGGWGQFLQSYLDAKAKVDNRAIGGRTARRFIDEGYLDKILTVIKAGCTHLGMPNWIQEILTGAIIVVAMTLDRVRQTARD
jgi:lysophospholipase L1-like esterase